MTTTLAKMDRTALRAAASAAGLEGYTKLGVVELREIIADRLGTTIDAEFVTPRRTMTVTTEPVRRAIAPRVVSVPFGSRINKHYNDDGSITLYAAGIKVHRTLATEGDDVEIDEDYDGEAEVEKFCKRWFGAAEHKFGKTTHSHNWKKPAKAPAEETAPEVPARPKRVRKSRAKAA